MKCLIKYLGIFCLLPTTLAAQDNGFEVQTIHWHAFEWQQQENSYFEQTPSKIITAKFHITGIPDAQTMALDLNSPFSSLFDFSYENMVYRNPSLAEQTETIQRVSNFNERLLKDMELSINRTILGEDNLFIQPTLEESRNENIKGMVGFGIFHRNKKILIVDNTLRRFASIDELPADMEASAHFVPLKVVMGYIVIPVTVSGKEVEMFFDGTSRPAMVVFNKRLLRQLSSDVPAAEMLRHQNGRENIKTLEGFEAEGSILFGQLPLANLDVYHSDDKAPSGIRGTLSRAFFDDYVIIFDYKNGRFGILDAGKIK